MNKKIMLVVLSIMISGQVYCNDVGARNNAGEVSIQKFGKSFKKAGKSINKSAQSATNAVAKNVFQVKPGTTGWSCRKDSECNSDLCYGAKGALGTCQPKQKLGLSCRRGKDCKTGSCKAGTCRQCRSGTDSGSCRGDMSCCPSSYPEDKYNYWGGCGCRLKYKSGEYCGSKCGPNNTRTDC